MFRNGEIYQTDIQVELKSRLTENHHVYVNGMSRPQDEVLGTKYFKAPVSYYRDKDTCSSWSKSKPISKGARIRRRHGYTGTNQNSSIDSL